jgi:hypothetical protein
MAPKRKPSKQASTKSQKRQKPLCPLRTAIVNGDAKTVKAIIDNKSPGHNLVFLIDIALRLGHEDVFDVLVNCNIPNDNIQAWDCVDERVYVYDSPVVYEALRARGLIGDGWLDEHFEDLLLWGAVKMVKHVNKTGTLDIGSFMVRVEFDAIQELHALGHVTATSKGVVQTLYSLVTNRHRQGIRWLLETFGHLIDKDAQADELWRIACLLTHGFNRDGIAQLLHEFGVLSAVRKDDNYIISSVSYDPFIASLPEVKTATIQGEDYFRSDSYSDSDDE